MTTEVATRQGGAVAAPADEVAQVAGLVSARWRDACSGLRAIVLFGAVMLRVEEWLKSEKGPRRGKKAFGLRGWLRKNCPEVEYKTAMGYRYAAEGLIALADKARGTGLLPLLAAPNGIILTRENNSDAAEIEAARAQVEEIIASASLRILTAAARAQRAALGGARDGAGRAPLLPEGPDSIRRAAAAVWQKIASGAAAFLSHKFAFALSGAEAEAALQAVDALRDALKARIAEEAR